MIIDILAAFENEPLALDFVLPGFVSGTVGALIAPGATGKSYFALEAIMSIACSVAGGDLLNLKPEKVGSVVYFAAEDPESVLIRRLYAIGRHLDEDAQRSIAGKIILEAVMGKRLNIMDDSHLRRIVDFCGGARLVVFDTLSRVHQLDENSNGDMSRLIANLEYIATETGAAVLFLHHTNKSSAIAGLVGEQQSARGASALVDNARWVAFIQKMTEAESKKLTDRQFDKIPIGDNRDWFVKFGISKQNYAQPINDRWYKRHDGGVLLPINLIEVKADDKKQVRSRRNNDI